MGDHPDGGTRRLLECGGHRGKGIAVLTSGGDSQGMNAAVRAVVRTSLYLGCNIFFVREGYQGLVDGDITVATWASVSSMIQKGGTIIGSARCLVFRTREGRLKAAKNLLNLGVNNLVVIGGDGSLTGANIFREEWKSLLEELVENGEVHPDVFEDMGRLNIIGIVGSIDNDFSGTDMTVGTDSALHRILEAIDAIVCTAYSHQRIFIMEVMGRHCGYLAISAGLLCSATAVFIPEDPPEEWEDDLCETITKEREGGQRLNIIIVAEGALDRNGNQISSEMIKDVVVNRLHQDTRITVLGHIQRGGNPSAFDRVLACRMGAEAVIALVESVGDGDAMVITLRGNESVRLPLMECVEKTKQVTKAMAEKNWDLAVRLRGLAFIRRLETYKTMHMVEKMKAVISTDGPKFSIAVLHIGSPACGMNSSVRAFVRIGVNNNIRVYGVTEGIDGLVKGDLHEMKWSEVIGWVGEGGALLGTRKALPRGKMKEIALRLREFKINGLFIIGGFEAFKSALMFYEERSNYKEFCIPILVAAATISNNVPGADYSLGCDTALNEIVEICDRMRQSAQGTKRRVFILETMGGYCGYLATMAGLAGGADAAYIFEEIFSIKDLYKDLYNMASKMCAGVQRGLIIRNERCSDNYNCDFMTRLFSEEGKGVFSTRSNVIGHMQQGGNSSPFDRSMGITIGIKAAQWFLEKFAGKSSDNVYTVEPETACVLGLVNKLYKFTPIPELAKLTDFDKRIPKNQWWLKLRPLLRIIAKHESTYQEGTFMYYDAAATTTKVTRSLLEVG